MKNRPDNLSENELKTFMETDWHVRPKLFRQAFKHIEPLCDIETVFEMATDENIESRLIQSNQAHYQLQHGPFEELPDLNTPNWTLLIQGLDKIIPEAHDFLQCFRFIPDARLDDIMLSLASHGGGVGPHYDTYDVFLIQMHGKRRWQIGPLEDKTLVANTPVKLLKHFHPTEEYVLEPGDMLYLPPNYAHNGDAVGVCSTISVGFRAFNKAELLSQLLFDLAEKVTNDDQLTNQLFSDPKRGLNADPSEIPKDIIAFAKNTLLQFQPDLKTIETCVGTLLSEPKNNVFFDSNQCADMSPESIEHAFEERGLSLAMGTKLLFLGETIFINGDAIHIKSETCKRHLKNLANAFELTPEESKNAFNDAEFKYLVIGFAKAGWLNTIE